MKRPLPLLICIDSETVDMMFWVGTKICETIEIFHDCDNWFFDEKKGFYRIFSNSYEYLRNMNQCEQIEVPKSKSIPVKFKVCLLNGDSKVQQVFCGTNSGSSYFRCYCCYRGSHEWHDLHSQAIKKIGKKEIMN